MTVQDVYGPIAPLYDTYVRADFDLDFFRECVRRRAGPVLELMAGTGRVSRAIFECNRRLTCVDISREMLRALSGRFAGALPGPRVVCADVRSLPLESCYELAFIPFNSFSELTAVEDQHQALAELNRVLMADGQLICTLHNPEVRIRSLDGRERLLGRYALEGERELEIRVTGVLTGATGMAQSRQVFRVYDRSGELVTEQLQVVHFALITQESFADLARCNGFDVVQLAGDYDGSSYDHRTSPYMIWTMKKLGARSLSP
jgi:SAM-dependent methyltransferase